MTRPALRIISIALCAFVWLPHSGWSAAQSAAETQEAQFNSGMAYALGSRSSDGKVIVEPNYAEAAKLFRMAADRGLAKAQRSLGELYQSGLGVEKNAGEAAKWFLKAADQGDARAQSNLGSMYVGGIGIKKDDKEAVKWLQKAADQGDVAGQFGLGTVLAGGRGVPRDPQAALDWYRKAAAQGLDLAKSALQQLAQDDIASVSAEPPQRINNLVTQATLIAQVKPSFPPAARAARVSGSVTLQAVISRTGRIKSIKVMKGDPVFNEAAMEAVRQWRYTPQMLGGQPIEVTSTIPVNFSFQ